MQENRLQGFDSKDPVPPGETIVFDFSLWEGSKVSPTFLKGIFWQQANIVKITLDDKEHLLCECPADMFQEVRSRESLENQEDDQGNPFPKLNADEMPDWVPLEGPGDFFRNKCSSLPICLKADKVSLTFRNPSTEPKRILATLLYSPMKAL